MGTIIPYSAYNLFYFFLIIIISAIISYFYYRKSVLSGRQKFIFTGLRFLSVFFILFLFLSPFYESYISGKALNIYLVDNSKSLKIEKRDSLLKKVLQEKFSKSSANTNNNFFLFSNGLIREINYGDLGNINYDSLPDNETNITKSLEMLQQYFYNKKISSITIISDGLINNGGNPSYLVSGMDIPVNYFLIGDTIQKNDLLVKSIFFNKTCFIESKVPVNVEINSYNYSKKIRCNLFENGKLIDSKYIDVNKNEIIYNIRFDVYSREVSVKKYKVEIEYEPGEITGLNNTKDFFIKFIDNKIKVLVIAGGPSPDVAFLSEELRSIKNIESKFLIQKSPAEFYEGNLSGNKDFQCVILIGFPTEITSLNVLNSLKENILENNASIFFISGTNTQYDKLYIFEDLLPFKTGTQHGGEIKTGIRSVLTENNELPGYFSFPDNLSKLPEIFYPSVDFIIKPNADILLLTTGNNKPAFSVLNYGKNHSASFFCFDFYKWRLNPENVNSGQFLQNLISGAILSVTNKDKNKKLSIETDKQIFDKGENILIKCFLHQQSGNENLITSISNNKFYKDVKMQKISNNEYDGEIKINDTGDYEIRSSLNKDGIKTEEDYQKISVDFNNDEYIMTKPDETILRNISNLCGGEKFTNKNSDEIKRIIEDQNRKDQNMPKEIIKLYLNINPLYFLILILILSLEWFLRKRENLP